MIKIQVIDEAHKQDINIPNEPFPLFGRMIPSYTNETWSYTIQEFEPDEIGEMCFPDENYNYDAMREDTVFLGAYDGKVCIGLAILRDHFLKYMYLYDLKVARAYRRAKVGALLIEKSKEISRERGYRGVYTQGQDNNLGACRFYLKSGFRIGGFDNAVYTGTSQEGKADITFYLDC